MDSLQGTVKVKVTLRFREKELSSYQTLSQVCVLSRVPCIGEDIWIAEHEVFSVDTVSHFVPPDMVEVFCTDDRDPHGKQAEQAIELAKEVGFH